MFATATVPFINSATWNLATAPGAVQHAVIIALAMIGGAFGTSLEGDEKVSDVACGRRQRERQRMLRQVSRPERGGRRGPDTTDG
ncbi:hypothetical protein ACWEN3_17780 [Streptomyces sp. NPDC004561]